MPPWMQEIILRCIEPQADSRYQSAAHVAFDLRNPEQLALTKRGSKLLRASIFSQMRRWWHARRAEVSQHVVSQSQASTTPVIMVAVDTTNPDDPRQPVLRRATAQTLSLSPEYRLICVSVVRAAPVAIGATDNESAAGIHLDHLVRLRHWVEPLRLPTWRLSLHVIESTRPESVLLDFARRNNVDVILLGAPSPTQHSLAWWRSVASTVTANARCSVYVVRVPEPGQSSDFASANLAPDLEDQRPA
jgi:nucleotide-binding universal stress UspA family protein